MRPATVSVMCRTNWTGVVAMSGTEHERVLEPDYRGGRPTGPGHAAYGRRYAATRCRRRRWLSLGVTMLCVSTALVAVSSSADESASVPRGHQIAVGGGPGDAGTACFSCHGLQGQGDAGGAFPRLAGLDAHYLAQQMDDYASGARANMVMAPIS